MSETKKKKSWPVVATIRKGDDGGSYIQLGENYGIADLTTGEIIKAKKSKAGKVNLKLESPIEKCEKFIELGYTKEEDIESARAKAAELNTWLKYDIVLPLPKED